MLPIRQSIVALEPLFQQRQCADLIAWAEQQGFAPRPGDTESPAFARCHADEQLQIHLWLRLVGAIEAATRQTPVRFAGPTVIDRFDAGQRLLPIPGGGVEVDRDTQTALAVVVFLNEEFAGGEFVCYPAQSPLAFAAQAGAGIVFPTFLTCEQLPVRVGRKYILLTIVAVAEE